MIERETGWKRERKIERQSRWEKEICHRGNKRKKDKGRRDREKKRMTDSVDCGRERERELQIER